ncbi:hypothetical protein V8Z80_10960 [Orrella sp. JC864]|uniref:hypothetical protein n=1 Tax=Orrella sp. JC864 TaxID=3120298 RepID=UPI0012BB5D00
MDKLPHELAPGYYWYTVDGDPPSVIHIHANGTATLMGTDFKMSAADVAAMVQRGERFFWIEPPPVGQDAAGA